MSGPFVAKQGNPWETILNKPGFRFHRAGTEARRHFQRRDGTATDPGTSMCVEGWLSTRPPRAAGIERLEEKAA
jgi:hypothetical protein